MPNGEPVWVDLPPLEWWEQEADGHGHRDPPFFTPGPVGASIRAATLNKRLALIRGMTLADTVSLPTDEITKILDGERDHFLPHPHLER
jgi:hypothetical protein